MRYRVNAAAPITATMHEHRGSMCKPPTKRTPLGATSGPRTTEISICAGGVPKPYGHQHLILCAAAPTHHAGASAGSATTRSRLKLLGAARPRWRTYCPEAMAHAQKLRQASTSASLFPFHRCQLRFWDASGRNAFLGRRAVQAAGRSPAPLCGRQRWTRRHRWRGAPATPRSRARLSGTRAPIAPPPRLRPRTMR